MASNTTPFVSGSILTAAQMTNLPMGIVAATAGGTSGSGYIRNTTTAVAIGTAAADVSGMTISWTAVSTRIYKVTVTLSDVVSGAGFTPLLIEVTDATPTTKYQARVVMPGNQTNNITFSYVETGISGTILRKVRTTGVTNTGTFNTNAAAALSVFVIEDIGAT